MPKHTESEISIKKHILLRISIFSVQIEITDSEENGVSLESFIV